MMRQPFTSVFENLVGEWCLEREVSTGESLQGAAVFTAVSKLSLLMHEEGELQLQSGMFIHATRDWYWHLHKTDELSVTYDEMRLQNYHSMRMSFRVDEWLGNAEHLCGEDIYSGSYAFWCDRFKIHQRVKGPKKNYSIISRYRKLYSK